VKLKIEYYIKTIRAFLELLRLRNCIIASIGVLIGAFFVYHGVDSATTLRVLMAITATFLITGGGNVINDYFDVEIDKINKPERPIPSRRVSRSDAFMFSIVLFLLGVGLSKQINNYCLIIAGINTGLLIFYAAHSKRIAFLSNIIVGYLVASVFLFGILSVLSDGTGSVLGAELEIVALITACAFFITVSREIIKDIEDMKGDRYNYSSTLPLKIGKERAKRVAILFGAGAILLSLFPFFMNTNTYSFNIAVYAVVVSISDIIFTISLFSPPFMGQRLMVVGMVIALMAFFLGKFVHIMG